MLWQWESFEHLLGPRVRVVDPGPLRGPVTRFSLRRSASRDLTLETTSLGGLRGRIGSQTARDLYELKGVVRFQNDFGLVATASGLLPGNVRAVVDSDGQRQTTQSSFVSRIEVSMRDPPPVAYTLDWVENLDSESCLWLGDSVLDDDGPGPKRTIGAGDGAIVFVPGDDGSSSARPAALELTVGGVSLFVCSNEERPGLVRPGYLLYRGAPDEETRRRIREVVGFSLGCGLVYLGSTGLSQDSELVWTTAVSGNPFGGRIFELYSHPPAPTGHGGERFVEAKVVSRCADALFRHYEEMNFRQLSWSYWHAACAPAHMAPAHYGAALEGLHRAYMDRHPNEARQRVITDNVKARKLLKTLRDALPAVGLDPDDAKVITDKIADLNRASGAAVFERIFAELGLQRGDAERSAWRRRNEAAHGKPRAPEAFVPLLQDTRLLRLLLNRTILRISGASPTYIDDYIGGAVRPLHQPAG